MWDLRAGSRGGLCALTLAGHSCIVRCLSACESGDNTIVSGGDDGNLKVWDLRSTTGGSRATLCGHTAAVTTVRWDWSKIVSGSADCTVRVWDVSSGPHAARTCGVRCPVNAVELHERYVAACGFDGIRVLRGSA